MRSFRLFNRRVGSILAAGTLVLAATTTSLAGAATVTNRSIALSSSTKSATAVSYEVKFKTPAATSSTGAYVVDFCTTAAINTTCTAPSGLDTSGVGMSSGGVATSLAANTVKVVPTVAFAASTNVDNVLTGIVNPSGTGLSNGTFYARIVTYIDGNDPVPGPGNFNYTAPDNLGSYLDDGSVALAVTDGFSVSGQALETLTFCAAASGDTIGSGCTGTLTSPSLTLGTGGILTTALSTGTVKTQLSTNASGGAVVSLKSNTTGCGGLARQGASSFAAGCGIVPITSHGAINTGDSKFGLTLANLGRAAGVTPTAEGSYNTTDYYLGWVSGDATGVTSTYGDPIYNVTGPVSDGTANLTFGANIGNLTPAGNYSASLNLIATGTF